MINPSVPGWIDKFFSEQKISEMELVTESNAFYDDIRKTGFVYGHIISLNTKSAIPIKGWFNEEVSKVALFNSLLGAYSLTKQKLNWEEFILETVAFYNEMHPEEFNLFKKLLPKNSPSLTLEKFIDERVQTNNNIISKNLCTIIYRCISFSPIFNSRNYPRKIPKKNRGNYC